LWFLPYSRRALGRGRRHMSRSPQAQQAISRKGLDRAMIPGK
jgi:hypothetical protein